MTTLQVKTLKPDDEVRWNDPDNDACSRTLVIKKIRRFSDGRISIVDTKGNYLECFARELTIAVKIERVGEKAYDINCSRHMDAHLHWEDDVWVLDIFNSRIKDADKAHVESTRLEKGNGNIISPDWNEVFEQLEVL
jgi:hypothetical protein